MGRKTKKAYIIIAAIVFVLCGSYHFIANKQSQTPKTSIELTPVQTKPTEELMAEAAPVLPSAEVKVHVAGAVQNPGVYGLSPESRVEDAVAVAGGFAEGADESALNLAAFVLDGQKITVPMEGETAAADTSDLQNAVTADGRININTATKEELMRLPGIGEVRANSIVQYREAHGGFRTVEELGKVSGIGAKTFEAIKDGVCVK